MGFLSLFFERGFSISLNSKEPLWSSLRLSTDDTQAIQSTAHKPNFDVSAPRFTNKERKFEYVISTKRRKCQRFSASVYGSHRFYDRGFLKFIG